MRRILQITGLILALGLASAASAGVLAGYDFTTDTSATNVDANVTASSLTEGAGVEAGNISATLGDTTGLAASGTSFGSTSLGSYGVSSVYTLRTTTLDGAFAGDDYYTVTVTANAGYYLNLSGFSLNTAVASTSNGRCADQFNVLAQVDGGTNWVAADALLSSDGLTTNTQAETEWTDTFIDLSADAAFQGITSAVFRVYLWGGSGTKTSTSRTSVDQLLIEGAALSEGGENLAPTADANSVTTLPDTAVEITLIGNDPEGSNLTYSVETQPASGSLSGTAPDLTYTPANGYRGADSFTFTVNDGELDSDAATVSITVTNQIPAANSKSVSTSYDTPLAITLAGSDPEETALTYSVVDSPTNGTLSGTAPDLTYTPASGYTGEDSFTFTVNDGFDDSAAATVSISVINELPVADSKQVATAPDTPVAITLSGSDTEGEDLTYAVVDAPTNGTLSGTAPDLTYTPTNGTVGTDSFTYTVNDGRDDSTPATISIVIANAAANVLAGYDFDDGAGNATTNATLTDANVTASIYDVGDGLFNVVASGGNSLSEYDDAEGNLFGTAADLSFGGSQDTFGFADMGNGDNLAGAINANDYMTFTVTSDAGYDMDLSRLTFRTRVNQVVNSAERWALFSSVGGFTNGAEIATGRTTDAATWSEDSNKVVVDLSAAEFQKLTNVTFRLYIYGGDNGSSSATLFDKVILHGSAVSDEVNRAPIADDQSVSTLSGTSLAITLTGSDLEGSNLVYTVGSPTNGTLSGTAPDLTYTPDAGYVGTDSFTFTVNDGDLDSDPATVSIEVQNQAAVALAQSATTSPDAPLAVTLTGSDPEGQTLSYTVVDSPTNGVLSGTAPDLIYTPTNGASGADSFTFTVNDGYEESDPATVSLFVAFYATDVLAGYDFDDGVGNATVAVTEQDTLVSASDYDVGAGLSNVVTSANALAEYTDAEGNIFGTATELSFGGAQSVFGFADMGDGGSLQTPINQNDYMTFTVTPDAGYALDLSRFTFRTFANTLSNSAERWALFSSVGGFTNGAEIATGQTTNAAVFVSNVIDLSAAEFQGLTGATEFRLYIYGGDNASSSATLFDKVILHGTVSTASTPESPTISASISGSSLSLSWDGGGTYNVLTNADLTVTDGWGVATSGTSPIDIEIGSDSQLFYKLESE